MSVVPPRCSVYELLDIPIRTRNSCKSPEQSFYLMDIVKLTSHIFMTRIFHLARKVRAILAHLSYSQKSPKSLSETR